MWFLNKIYEIFFFFLVGESGFTKHWSLQTGNSNSVKVMLISRHLFVIVTQSNKCHGSLVFRAQIKGESLVQITFRHVVNIRYNY